MVSEPPISRRRISPEPSAFCAARTVCQTSAQSFAPGLSITGGIPVCLAVCRIKLRIPVDVDGDGIRAREPLRIGYFQVVRVAVYAPVGREFGCRHCLAERRADLLLPQLAVYTVIMCYVERDWPIVSV